MGAPVERKGADYMGNLPRRTSSVCLWVAARIAADKGHEPALPGATVRQHRGALRGPGLRRPVNPRLAATNHPRRAPAAPMSPRAARACGLN
jgi:hypothetical protein